MHPATENLTNIEVARVYTVIDPRKPLPEAVNAQFDSGEITRITVSCPWLPSLCSYCRTVGHTISRCPTAPRTCNICHSVKHGTEACPRNNHQREGKAPIASQYPIVSGYTSKGTMSMRPNKSKTKKTTSQWVRTAPVKEPPHSDSHAHPSVQARKASSAQVLNVERFCVDLRTNLFDLAKKTTPVSASEYESEPESFSPDEDNPDDDADRYIQVISKRQKKLLKSSARARGPLNL
ncbi:unnamed protein product [Brassica oleracea]